MRSFPLYGFWLSAGLALFVACEPDLDPLSKEFGFGGKSSNGGAAGMAGLPNTGGSSKGGSGSAGLGGVDSSGGTENTGGGISPEGGSPVVVDECTDQKKQATESDVDCGGLSSCPRCDLGFRCTDHSDCITGVCLDRKCAAPSCADGVWNQMETAVDCGGNCADVSPCDDGEACKAGTDCASQFCYNRVCTDHCTSRKKEADETGIDCGGITCMPCPNDAGCLVNADCASGVCNKDKICVAPSCGDLLKNQDESDVDCGGVCSAAGKACPVSAKCTKPSDCDTFVCTEMKCVADIVIPTNDMIDNMEDGNTSILPNGGRFGNWYPFGDGTGMVTLEMLPLSPKRVGSSTALHFTSNDFKTWGSGMGFDFLNTGTSDADKKPYDASAYSGITFWGKAAVATGVTMQLPDIDTQKAGKMCTTCDHHYGALVPFTTEWQRFVIRWSDLQLEPGTVPAPTAFASNGIIAFQLFFVSGKTVDLWLDDIALIK